MEEVRDLMLERLEELSRSIEDLQRRTAALEQGTIVRPQAIAVAMPAAAIEMNRKVEVASLAPLFGWALMGLAGAYLLRAATESGSFPGALAAIAGLLYAALWLWLAARKSSTIHAVTGALILAPMLYETTVRFHILPLVAASGVLIIFTLFGIAVAWKQSLSPIAWIVTLTAIGTSCALFRETHNATALTATLLVIAAAIEISACRDHWLGLRWLTAIFANASVYAIGAKMNGVEVPGPTGILAIQVGLLAIYLGSTIDRSVFRGMEISIYEILQVAVAFAVALNGALQTAGETTVGVFCAIAGTACYVLSFSFIDKKHGKHRNFFTYSTFGLLLIGLATAVLLTGAGRVAVWSVLSVGLMIAGFARGRDTLRVHGAVFLVIAVLQSNLLIHAWDEVFHASAAALPAGYLAAWIAALTCYALILRADMARGWSDSAELIGTAALTVWGAGGLLAQAIGMFATAAPPLRTGMLILLAIGSAACGARWPRSEAGRLAYPLLALAALKLAIEDFRQGQSLGLFVSLILVGGGLLVLPRIGKQALPH